MISDEAISAQIEALLTPALGKQKKYCRQLGLRDRILTLPLMVAAVLTGVVERCSWGQRINENAG